MGTRFYLPLRLKILIAVLFVVTVIVSVITFTMATMFHDDKSAYVTDLVSLAAMSAADETHTVLNSYVSRLLSAGRVLRDEKLPADAKRALLNDFFTDFPELVGLAIHGEGQDVISAVDPGKIADAGVSGADLEQVLAAAPARVNASTSPRVIVSNASPSEKLSCVLIALPLPSQDGQPDAVIAALVRPDGLMPIASRPSSLEVAISDSDGVLLADKNPQRVAGRKRLDIAVSSAGSGAGRTSAVTKRAEVGGQAVIIGMASTRIGGVTATATIPAATAFLASRSLLQRLMLVSLGLLAVAAFGAAMWARRITGPVERLSAATGEIAKGQFDTKVLVESADEIGRLGESFNAMASELKSRDAALHEAQGQLVQSEKMAAFGLLGAGIAHEVKNPLAGILGCAQISLRQAQAGTPVHANLVLIEKETKRCKTIIENLLRFARQEKAATELFDVSRPLEDAVSIVHHQLELQQVKLETSLATDLPPIRGNANQLQQVFMNLFINAQQAMGADGGSVMVHSARRGDRHVEIIVRDTGSGIPKEIQKRIFDPFFTTKPNGKGTGLGLSVTYGIVKDHGGEISVESAPGKGTTFTIVLPTVEPAADPLHGGRELVGAKA
jgi:signal transduction histidine kinase